MEERKRTFIAIDLKSFYASAECVSRGLDPLTTNLVVADASRTEKTICLAVSPSLKSYGIGGRPRLFEVVQKVKEINRERARRSGGSFTGSSVQDPELKQNPHLSLDFVTAPPRMAMYMKISSRIYDIYLKYIAPEDIHVYSVDEVFMDVTEYLNTYGMSAHDLARTMIRDVLSQTGITATAGIGTNLFLCKVAMDIVAKHIPADEDGVRIAELDEISYRQKLWDHRPLTDFWRVGRGYAARLEQNGLYTMGDIARCSIGKPEEYYNEDLLFRLFGVNAELLIDHAWGYEPCRIADIKAYKPQSSSIGEGQVLTGPYTFDKARIVVKEMSENLSLNLVKKGLVSDQIVLTVGYDISSLENGYQGEIKKDFYGRMAPKSAHGSASLKEPTSSTILINDAVMRLYDRIVGKKLLVRRIYLCAVRLQDEEEAKKEERHEQLSLFEEDRKDQGITLSEEEKEKERAVQDTLLKIREKYGRTSVIKGLNKEEGATGLERAKQIGGHKA